MKIHAKIQKWGNGLALRVSGPLRDIPHFTEGADVDIEVTPEGFFVKKTVAHAPGELPFTEAQLLADLTPHGAHADELATPSGKEWDY